MKIWMQKTLYNVSIPLFQGSSALFGNSRDSLVEASYKTIRKYYLVWTILPWQFNLQGYVYKITAFMSRTSFLKNPLPL